ncbi:MAG: patatin-like phospholipase family protein, partial [Nocardioidaceae bacterium]
MDHRSGSEPEQDLRLAVVLNGGVSLAVWMGGAVHEIDRLTRRAGPGYDSLLDHLSIRSARADVITGSSAGGINGALLALAQVNKKSPSLSLLRDLWAEQGDI